MAISDSIDILETDFLKVKALFRARRTESIGLSSI